MKGAGTTLAYVFPGLPYTAGVVLVGMVITLNVALGGMKGITLVQAFQYWLKMFAISVPVFVLMAVYGHYGRQLARNQTAPSAERPVSSAADAARAGFLQIVQPDVPVALPTGDLDLALELDFPGEAFGMTTFSPLPLTNVLRNFGETIAQVEVLAAESIASRVLPAFAIEAESTESVAQKFRHILETNGLAIRYTAPGTAWVLPFADLAQLEARLANPAPPSARWGPADATWIQPFGPLTTKAQRAANLSAGETKAYALLYTYSLIIALVCGTAGLPHILVRFYTNPDGVAAKRTTMWVMILIGVFYLFPPIFGVMGRNLLPELYAGVGAKGTDKVVLELPRVVDRDHRHGEANSDATGGPGSPASAALTAASPASAAPRPMADSGGFPWGSILSGITCAGAFAAFMSTFSGLLVSMTGALAHDIYGRILRPESTASERMRMFKVFAWVIGGIATLLGCFVERLQINFMVGQAFAIAAASYFPLLFMSVWWKGMTMRGAATGMLAGGISAVLAVSVTNFSDLGWLPLQGFWAAHPLLRILAEQPAIWAVPGAVALMILVSLFTSREIPSDIRMKMLVLHAPESLGLKREYIREHEGH
jgi:Na+(H+)/acetate symporter ActP